MNTVEKQLAHNREISSSGETERACVLETRVIALTRKVMALKTMVEYMDADADARVVIHVRLVRSKSLSLLRNLDKDNINARSDVCDYIRAVVEEF